MTIFDPNVANPDARVIVRRVGVVLIIVGLLDILSMFVAISRHQSYSSDVNIFAVIAGVLLIRGSLKPLRGIRWLAGFIAGGALWALIYLTVTTPASLVFTEIRLHDLREVVNVIMGGVVAALALWVYTSLNDPVVRAALFAEFGVPRWRDRPWTSFSVGLATGVVFLGLIAFDRPNIDAALAAAKHRFGGSYEYAMTSYSRVNDYSAIGVAAYNPSVINRVIVVVVHNVVKRIIDTP